MSNTIKKSNKITQPDLTFVNAQRPPRFVLTFYNGTGSVELSIPNESLAKLAEGLAQSLAESGIKDIRLEYRDVDGVVTKETIY